MSNPLKKSEKWKSPLTSMHRTPIRKWREGKQQNARQAFSEQRRHLKMKQYCVWLEKKLTHCLWWWQKYEMKAQRSREITVVCEAQWGKRRNIKGEEWWRANVSEIYRSTKTKGESENLERYPVPLLWHFDWPACFISHQVWSFWSATILSYIGFRFLLL